MTKHEQIITMWMNVKQNVESAGFMLAPDAITLIGLLIVQLEENKKLRTQLDHAWLNNGEYISCDTVLN